MHRDSKTPIQVMTIWMARMEHLDRLVRIRDSLMHQGSKI